MTVTVFLPYDHSLGTLGPLMCPDKTLSSVSSLVHDLDSVVVRVVTSPPGLSLYSQTESVL